MENNKNRLIKFNASCKAPYHELSNFAQVTVTLSPALVEATPSFLAIQPQLLIFLDNTERTFPSTEHLWQSLKALDRATFLAFTTTGRFGTWDPDFFLSVVNKKHPEKALVEMKRWQQKNLIGIMAKLAASKHTEKVLGLEGHLQYNHEYALSAEVEQEVWLAILRLKFLQQAHFKELLVSTGTSVLYHGVAAHKRMSWGAVLRRNEDGHKVLMGDNKMGKYLSLIREECSH